MQYKCPLWVTSRHRIHSRHVRFSPESGQMGDIGERTYGPQHAASQFDHRILPGGLPIINLTHRGGRRTGRLSLEKTSDTLCKS